MEGAVQFGVVAVAVDYRCRDDVPVVRVCALDGDRLSVEPYVSVAVSGVGADCQDDCLTVVGVIDRLLYCVIAGVCGYVPDGTCFVRADIDVLAHYSWPAVIIVLIGAREIGVAGVYTGAVIVQMIVVGVRSHEIRVGRDIAVDAGLVGYCWSGSAGVVVPEVVVSDYGGAVVGYPYCPSEAVRCYYVVFDLRVAVGLAVYSAVVVVCNRIIGNCRSAAYNPNTRTCVVSADKIIADGACAAVVNAYSGAVGGGVVCNQISFDERPGEVIDINAAPAERRSGVSTDSVVAYRRAGGICYVDAGAEAGIIVEYLVFSYRAVAPLSQMDTAAIGVSVVVLDEIAGYYGVAALEGDDCSAVTMVVGGVVGVGRRKTVLFNHGVVDEGVVRNYGADMHGRVAGVVRVDGVAVYVDAASLACRVIDKEVFCNRRCGHITADDASTAAVPSKALKLP